MRGMPALRDDVVDEIASRLRAWREHRGYTVTELSERSGINMVTIYRIEGGHQRNLQLSTLYALCEALEVKIAKILANL